MKFKKIWLDSFLLGFLLTQILLNLIKFFVIGGFFQKLCVILYFIIFIIIFIKILFSNKNFNGSRFFVAK